MPTVNPVVGSPVNPNVVAPAAAPVANAAVAPMPAGPAAVVGNPNASGAALVAGREIAGLPEGFDAANVAISGRDGAAAGITGQYIARPTADSGFVAYGDISTPRPTPTGFDVDVTLYTTQDTDRIALLLQVPLLDTVSGQLTYFNLDLLTFDSQAKTYDESITTTAGTEPISGASCFTGRRSYSFSLDKINAYLAQQKLGVQVGPQDQLAISGFIAGDGHRVMNGVSNTIAVPEPLSQGALSPVALQASGTQAPLVKGRALPLDLAVKLADGVLNEEFYDADSNSRRVGDVIAGTITTRLESEYKGSVERDQLMQMIDRAYAWSALSEKALAGDAAARAELDHVLGKNVVMVPVSRHWLASDGKAVAERSLADVTIQRDEHGWPRLDPMRDQYSDNATMDISRICGGIRVRSNSQKEGDAEFKLTGGIVDPKTGIRQRVEIAVTLQPGATEADLMAMLASIRNDPSSKLAQSPLGHIVQEAMKANVAEALTDNRTPWADVTQIRHKFELRNTKTRTSAELSLDQVHVRTLRPEHQVNGKPQEADFYVVETELDHLQLNSSNVTAQQSVLNKSALVNKTEQESFVQAAQQALAAGSMHLETLKKPQLHSIDHISEGSFRSTASYREFEKMQSKMLKALCDGFKPGPAYQKAAHAAQLFDFVFFDNKHLMHGIREVVERGGYQWTRALEKAFTAAIAEPAKKKSLEEALARGVSESVARFVGDVYDTSHLSYNLSAVKARVRARLESLGFDSNAAVETMFDTLTPAKLRPDMFESMLADLAMYDDTTLFDQFASTLGVAPAPSCVANPERLLGNPTAFRELDKVVAERHAAPETTAELIAYMKLAVQRGVSMLSLRGLLECQSYNLETQLEIIAMNVRPATPAPVLHLDPAYALKLAGDALHKRYRVMDDGLRDFAVRVCHALPLGTAESWFGGGWSNPDDKFERQARLLGVPVPAAVLDLDRFEKDCVATCKNAYVTYDAALATFIRTLVTHGVPPEVVMSTLIGLANDPDVADALRAAGAYLVGVPLPKVRYDLQAIEKAMRDNLGTNQDVFGDSQQVRAYIQRLLDVGASSDQVLQYSSSHYYSGSAYAASAMEWPATGWATSNTPPPLPVSMDGLCNNLKRRLGASFTTALEQYLRAAYPQAEKNPQFGLSQLIDSDAASLAGGIAYASGVPAPAGL